MQPITPLRAQRLRPTVLAATLALLGAGPLPALAQAAALQAARGQHAYDIPAQPLGLTLTRIATESGQPVSVDAALVQGIAAPAVRGSYTAEQAVRAALAGSGLAVARTGSGALTAVRAPAVPAASVPAPSLGEVRVTAEAERSGATEGTGSYQATATNTAAKLSLTPRETPQTVTVVTRQQMQDFGMTSVDDALQTVNGAFVAAQGNNGAQYYSRGFEMQSQYDGVPNPGGISNNNRNPQIDNAFLDRVETVQGAAGLLTGAGQPGGTINLVRKRPTEAFQASAEMQLASWDGRRIVGDISAPLTESGRIRGRVVAVADNSKSFVDYAYRNRRAIYAVAEADLTATTTLEASVQYQRDTGRNHLGAPFAADGSEPGIRRSFFWGDAGQRTVKDYTLTTLGLTQRLAGDWQAKATFSHNRTNSDIFRYSYARGELDVTTGDGLVLGRQRSLTQDLGSNAADVHVSGPFQWFGRKHEAAFGLNGSTMRHTYTGAGYIPRLPINVNTFDPSALDDIPGATPYSGDTKTTQLGAYGVARWSVTDALKLITGVRVSHYKDENLLTKRTSSEESGVISPYAGLIYDLNTQVSVYASYSDIFTPQIQKTAGGGTVKPVVGANYEAGIKGELLDKRLNVSAAVFRLEQTNLARRDESIVPDPANACGGTCYIAADKVVSQGIDLGASGEIATGWNVAAGYTFTGSKYASGATDGQRYNPQLPRHSLRLSTAYKLPNTGWTLGGNVSARSRIYRNDSSWDTGAPYTVRSGGLVLVGLMARYEITPKADLTLAVSNLFDRTYRANLENKYYSPFGEPRRISANLKYRF
ncbi:MAG: hypothetical protein ABT02_08315 [Comamonadaceae bacterium SCN 68-20]|nr:MAG: hypothetical protein ABT02_08315 [Comamonadaceae bacterium SCN 68-20]OJX28978.1 MAG: hypothetical protein BGO75_18730 [Burkholderiales bacterium 68-20]